MSKEALKLALEALEKNTKHLPVHFDCHFEAITAIKEALAQPEQETEDLTIAYMAGFSRGKDLTPQRTWVGLTDEEVTDLWHKTEPYYNEYDFAKAYAAKLKEKNT